MPIHLYCLLPAASEVAPPASIRIVPAPAFAAWIGDASRETLSRDARDAVRATIEHDRIVSSALAQGVTPLPASLADPYGNEAEMALDVGHHASAIADALSAIEGKVEMTTIIAMNDVAPPEGSPGRGRVYLEQLRSQPTRVSDVTDAVAAAMRGMAGSERRRASGGRSALSHLVRRDQVDDYRRAALSQASAEYRIVIDGPRAPYSFALFSPRRGMILAT